MQNGQALQYVVGKLIQRGYCGRRDTVFNTNNTTEQLQHTDGSQ